MKSRYTIWDGRQKLALDAEKIFDRLAEHFAATDDLSEALARLLREGMQGEEFEAIGLDELADRVREAIRELFDKFNLSRSLEEPWENADDIVAAEEEAADSHPSAEERARRRQELESLSRILEERLSQLENRPFDDLDAKESFDRLKERGGDIARVERFQRRFRDQFQGPESLDFEGTLSLIEKFEKLRDLEKALREKAIDSLDGEALAELLGQEFADAIDRLRQMMRLLVDAGYVVSRGGRASLTPKAARRLGRLALKEMLSELLPDAAGRHDTSRRGPSEQTTEQVRQYEFGDTMSIDVAATVKVAIERHARAGTSDTHGARSTETRGRPGKVELEPDDLQVKESLRTTRTSTVLLLDMSWSMSWEGRFAAAKKVAMAMETLMRTRFPRDYFGMVGFYTRAVELRPADLAEVTWNMGDPFTNLQDGLRVASRLLDRHPATTRQMIVITDGQPTAYFSEGRLFCEWPMSVGGISSRATVETLKEVERVTRRGVRINTFMLDDSPLLRAFVQKMTAINRGRAFYTTPEQLGHFVLVDHVGKKRKVL
ncbi:MAG TPA: VWA domain-containing protein [Candidatus Limnocylindrales bacterium]|nr:VWA domain-containing protein [Candidatus Limnocylindrales bacterium]